MMSGIQAIPQDTYHVLLLTVVLAVSTIVAPA